MLGGAATQAKKAPIISRVVASGAALCAPMAAQTAMEPLRAFPAITANIADHYYRVSCRLSW